MPATVSGDSSLILAVSPHSLSKRPLKWSRDLTTPGTARVRSSKPQHTYKNVSLLSRLLNKSTYRRVQLQAGSIWVHINMSSGTKGKSYSCTSLRTMPKDERGCECLAAPLTSALNESECSASRSGRLQNKTCNWQRASSMWLSANAASRRTQITSRPDCCSSSDPYPLTTDYLQALPGELLINNVSNLKATAHPRRCFYSLRYCICVWQRKSTSYLTCWQA
jgi:hypothetical protein